AIVVRALGGCAGPTGADAAFDATEANDAGATVVDEVDATSGDGDGLTASDSSPLADVVADDSDLGAPCDPMSFRPYCDALHRVHACYGTSVRVGFYCAGSGIAAPDPFDTNACVTTVDDTGQSTFECVDRALRPCDPASYGTQCVANAVARCVAGTDAAFT